MQKLITMFKAILVTAALTAPAAAFKCESGSGTIFSPAECSCKGTEDCKDMRKSKLCKGDLDCKTGSCSCTAAFTPADDGGEIKKRVTDGVMKNTQPLTAQ
jgi:uncharacterized membrane protein